MLVRVEGEFEEEDRVLKIETKNEKFTVMPLYYALESRTLSSFRWRSLEEEDATSRQHFILAGDVGKTLTLFQVQKRRGLW